MKVSPHSNLRRAVRTLSVSTAGDAMVREVDVSRMTLRLMEKEDKKGEDNSEHVVAKLVGETLPTLQRCLVSACSSSAVDKTDEM